MVLGGLCSSLCLLPAWHLLISSSEPSGHSWAEGTRKGSLGVVAAIIPRVTVILCSIITAGGCRVHWEMGCGWLGPAPVVEAAPQNPLWGFFQPSSSHRNQGKSQVESVVWSGCLKCAARVWVSSGDGCSELASPASWQSLWPPRSLPHLPPMNWRPPELGG